MREEGIATQKVFPSETSKAEALKTVEERIVKKSLDVIVLNAVKEEPFSGYGILLLIHKKFGVKLSAGTVYSLLRSLEKKGLVKGDCQKARYYTLTERGEKTLTIITNTQNRMKALNNDIF